MTRVVAWRVTLVGMLLGLLLLTVGPARSAPIVFEWGSYDAGGDDGYGVYDADNLHPLATGSLVQLIWAGPDGDINAPGENGAAGGDDQLLATSQVLNGPPLPPPMQDRGYVALNAYSFDSDSSANGGVVFVRAWNGNTIASAAAYGDSEPGTLTDGGVLNAPRWQTDQLVTSVTLRQMDTPKDATSALFLGTASLTLIALGAGVLLTAKYRDSRNP